jgi:DMSO/TMAO reductase YedYZ molybdopterin-dependent catalytic subunit
LLFVIGVLMDNKEKRIASMLRRLEAFKALPASTAEIEDFRLPPGQSWVRKGFPVLDLGEYPEISENDWSLVLTGVIGEPVALTIDQLLAMPAVSLQVDIHCVTAWSVPDALWLGVSTRQLSSECQLSENVTHALVHSHDGYSANLALADLFADDSIIAYGLNGKELSVSHGGPVRLVIAHLYLWKSPKWIKHIKFQTEDRPGFWEQPGYHNRGNPWAQERGGQPVRPAVQEPEPLVQKVEEIAVESKKMGFSACVRFWRCQAFSGLA